MRLRPLAYLIPWLAATAFLLSAAPGPPADPGEPLSTLATRQNDFSIPFKIDRSQPAAQQPAEVELYLSIDRGASWQLSSKVKPEQGYFVFRAPHDGEYWFSIRTIDKIGNPRPEGSPQPEVKVLVDTVPPRLDLLATRGAGGEVVTQWQIVDPDLKPESLKIEIQSGPNEPWETVAIDTKTGKRSRHALVGQTTCWPKPGPGPITVRAQVTDRAGNPAVNQVQIESDKAALGDKDPAIPVKDRAAAARDKNAPAAPPSSRPASTPPGRDAGAPRAWPADNAASEPLDRRDQPASPSAVGPDKSRDADWRSPSSTDSGWQQNAPQARNVSTSTQGFPTGKSAGVEQNPRGDGRPRALELNLLPAGERPHMVNARSFELEYDVDSVGSSGIAKVEIWGTRDGGRTWSSFGFDEDKRSPIRVNVDREGIYGFRIVVQSGNGLGGLPPRDGDLPEIWIGVDLTKPLASITAANINADTGELIVRWNASDDLPDPRPISLSFSDRPNGPWSAIASGLENTGSYAWRLENRVPDKIYLRLEARDEAGNVTVVISGEPVLLDRQRPKGRIRGIRPLDAAARTTPEGHPR